MSLPGGRRTSYLALAAVVAPTLSRCASQAPAAKATSSPSAAGKNLITTVSHASGGLEILAAGGQTYTLRTGPRTTHRRLPSWLQANVSTFRRPAPKRWTTSRSANSSTRSSPKT